MELINTVWEVPNRYQDLMPVGTGAFGQVNTQVSVQRWSSDSCQCLPSGLLRHGHRATLNRRRCCQSGNQENSSTFSVTDSCKENIQRAQDVETYET